MSWYIWLYIACFAVVGIFSAYDDRKSGLSGAYIVMDAMITAVWIFFVIAYYRPSVAAPLGPGVSLLLVAAVVWTVFDVRREIRAAVAQRSLSYDAELSARTNLLVDRAVEVFGVLLGVVFALPALIFAWIVVLRAW